MTQLVTGLFTSHKSAEAALQGLRRIGLRHESARMHTGSAAEVVAALQREGVPAAEAAAYGQGLKTTDAVVVARPAFGQQYQVVDVMKSHSPTKLHTHGGHTTHFDSSYAAPFSNNFGWRVLSDDPTPLSRFFNWSLLAPKFYLLSGISEKKLSTNPTPFSNFVGMAALSPNPTPFSDMFGWKVLKDDPTPFSKMFGWKMLLHDATPLSRKLGWKTLSHDATPLSHAVGARTLSEEPTPLSTAVDAPALKPPAAPKPAAKAAKAAPPAEPPQEKPAPEADFS
jgi:hypothetical protein